MENYGAIDVAEILSHEEIEDLNQIRQQRLNMATSQLLRIEETFEEMLRRGILSPEQDQREQMIEELALGLKEKIQHFAERLAEPTKLFRDEIDFLLSLKQA